MLWMKNRAKPSRGCSIVRTNSRSQRLKRVFGRWRQKITAPESPEGRNERIRSERINNLKHDVDLLEAMRMWEIGNRKRLVSKKK